MFASSEAARLLDEVRRSGRRLERLPEHLRPRSLAQAYAMQDEYARSHGAFAWKVGPAKSADQEPRCAVILGAPVASPAAVAARWPQVRGVELEIAITLGADLPGHCSIDQVRASIAGFRLGLELLSSRFTDPASVTVEEGIGDHQGNFGLVIGPGLADWRSSAQTEFSLEFDGAIVGTVGCTLSVDALLALVAWLSRHAAARGFPLCAGHTVITGARLGPFGLEGVRHVVGRAGHFPPVELRLSPPDRQFTAQDAKINQP